MSHVRPVLLVIAKSFDTSHMFTWHFSHFPAILTNHYFGPGRVQSIVMSLSVCPHA